MRLVTARHKVKARHAAGFLKIKLWHLSFPPRACRGVGGLFRAQNVDKYSRLVNCHTVRQIDVVFLGMPDGMIMET